LGADIVLLNESLFKKIEGVLHNRLIMQAEVDRWKEEAEENHPIDQALSRQPFDPNSVGNGKSKYSDSTAILVMQRTVPPPELRNKQRWLKVIDSVREQLKDTPKGIFLDKYYNGIRAKRNGYKMQNVCDKLYISCTTGKIWREEIVNLTALTAAMSGLLRNEKRGGN
jgi:hypothetical protein